MKVAGYLPLVELLDTTDLVDLSDGVAEASVATALGHNLNADLDHVHWLDLKAGVTKRALQSLTQQVAVMAEQVPTAKFLKKSDI